MTDRITALSWNVNGLRAAHKKGFLDWLSATSPEFLCLQETKAHVEQLPLEIKDISGYHSYFCSGKRKGYSGVAIYSKTEPISVEYGFGIEKFDNEGRILVADYGTFTLINIYFPNGQSSGDRLDYKIEFYDAFLNFVDILLGIWCEALSPRLPLGRPSGRFNAFAPKGVLDHSELNSFIL